MAVPSPMIIRPQGLRPARVVFMAGWVNGEMVGRKTFTADEKNSDESKTRKRKKNVMKVYWSLFSGDGRTNCLLN